MAKQINYDLEARKKLREGVDQPGVKPGSPVETLIPDHDPEISPSVEPHVPHPAPSEIPVPEKET